MRNVTRVCINAFGMAMPPGSGKRANAENRLAGRQVGFVGSGNLIPSPMVPIGAVLSTGFAG